MDHTCYYCRVASQLNIEQIERFVKSKLSMEEFINQPYEDDMSTLMRELMDKHELKKKADAKFASV